MNQSAAHHQLKRAILLDLGSEPDVRLFENPRGFDERAKATYGLAPHASDLIGLVKPVGRLLALEVKTGNARATPGQLAFLAMINAFGGLGRVVRSVAEARAALAEARR